jgi:hypothetical protein
MWCVSHLFLQAYEEVLSLMKGNHPATRYFLGTCQLDWGMAAPNLCASILLSRTNARPTVEVSTLMLASRTLMLHSRLTQIILMQAPREDFLKDGEC